MANIQFTPYTKTTQENYKLPKLNIPTIVRRSKTTPIIINTPLNETEDEVIEKPKIIKGTTTFKGNINIGNMQPVIDKFNEHGISIRVTSGLRPGAMTASGNLSHHAHGNALDITPGEGETWDTMKSKLKASPELVSWLQQNGFGILDETKSDTMRKTGATGAHWHIGKDTSAIKGLQALIARQGGILKAQQGVMLIDSQPASYTKQYNLSYNPFIQKQSDDFNKCYAAVAEANNLSPNPDDPEHYYDYRGYFKEHNNAAEEIKGHFDDKYKLPGHETFSIESKYYKPGMMAGHWENEDEYVPTPFSEDEMDARQHYAESRFNNSAVSKSGARGAYQIMKATWDEIVKKNSLNANINNYSDNKKVKDIYMRNLERYPTIAKAKEPIKTALKYAAYNMGIGNLDKFIAKELEKGIDVYKNWDWIDDLNHQTKQYVNFIVRGIDGSNDLTESDFKKALPNRFK